MALDALISAPPFHVQSSSKTLKNGFPCFSHHDSVSALWNQKWRTPCEHGIYPFTDAKLEDFEPIFQELIVISGDRPDFLCRPDEYAKTFFPVGDSCTVWRRRPKRRATWPRRGIFFCGPLRSTVSRDSRSIDPKSASKPGNVGKQPT